ncbi:hypothetical protein D3C79_47600 [compost metagenome]
MSHLVHVLPIKNFLTEKGVLCPMEQSHLLNEAYIRAALMVNYSHPGHNVEAFKAKLWKQLECWNRVSPVNAPYIHNSVFSRTNLIAGALATSGTLPCAKQFNTWPQEEGLEVNVAEAPGFNELVQYLSKELEHGNE